MEALVQLSGRSLVLRPYRDGDEEGQLEAVRASVAELGRWMDWCHPGYALADSRKWVELCTEGWASGTQYGFCLIDPETGDHWGDCTLSGLNRAHGFANLGYWIRTDRAGRGAATAAAGLVARFGLEQLALNRIEIVVAVVNLASQRVAEKLGAVREGVLRRRLVVRGEAQDAVMFSLIASDLSAKDV
ncbi:GNAT family N-acetyltransferase [Sorangium cellulosum]|nr:GNAT family protein [Sorangium cellulosum]